MSLLGILFVIAFALLLCKAIIETIWGSVLIIQGLLCCALAAVLRLVAKIIRITKKLLTKPEPPKPMLGDVIRILYSSTPEGERMRASLRKSF